MGNSTKSFKDHVLYPLFSNNKNMKVFFYCSESVFLNWTYDFSMWTGIFRITERKVPWCDCLVHLPAAIWHQLFLTFLICLYCLKMSNNKYFRISLNNFIECFASLKLRGFSWYITFLCFDYWSPSASYPIPNKHKEYFISHQEFLQIWTLKWPGISVWFCI